LTFCLNKISDQEQELGNKCAFSKPMKPGGLIEKTTESSWARKSTINSCQTTKFKMKNPNLGSITAFLSVRQINN
jgi:hypothetical protein